MFISTPPADMLRFSGKKATRAAYRNGLTTNQFFWEVSRDKDPYIGTLPKPICALGRSEPEARQAIDHLAKALKFMALPNLQDLCFQIGQIPVSVNYAGEGAVGSVYKLQVGGQAYALKVFRQVPRNIPAIEHVIMYKKWHAHGHHHGAYAEIRNGAFLSRFRFKDCAQFYCGNPKVGWSLMEWIDRKTDRPEKRKGLKIDEFFKAHGYQLGDPKPQNAINGILIDLGSVGPVKPKAISWRVFHHKMTSQPQLREKLAHSILQLPEQHQLAGFDLAMQYPESKAAAALYLKSVHVDKLEERDKRFNQVLADPVARVNAAYTFGFCSSGGREKQMKQILDSQDSQAIGVLAAENINVANPVEPAQKGWLKQILASPEGRLGLAQQARLGGMPDELGSEEEPILEAAIEKVTGWLDSEERLNDYIRDRLRDVQYRCHRLPELISALAFRVAANGENDLLPRVWEKVAPTWKLVKAGKLMHKAPLVDN